MNPAIVKLQSVTAALLSPVLDYNTWRESTISLSKLFADTVGFNEMEEANQSDMHTQSGKAIAPRWAALCLTDFMRTRKFILGIKDAIEEKLKSSNGQPVTVIYAGTGPFASLITPLTTIYSPLQLQVVLIEINPSSILCLKKIVKEFNMNAYVIEMIETDAAIWSLPQYIKPDIVISETMNNALQKEPQVSIVSNLLSQCSPDTVLIPELIKVEVCLLGNTMENPEDILHLETLLSLDAETAVKIKDNPEQVAAISQGIIVNIPELPPERFTRLALNTSILIFGQHRLGFNESGLTIPHVIMKTHAIKKYPASLLFQYHVNANPGFVVNAL